MSNGLYRLPHQKMIEKNSRFNLPTIGGNFYIQCGRLLFCYLWFHFIYEITYRVPTNDIFKFTT